MNRRFKSELLKKMESLEENLQDVLTNVAGCQAKLRELKKIGNAVGETSSGALVNGSNRQGQQGQISANDLLKLVDELKSSIDVNHSLHYDANYKLGQMKQFICDSSANEPVNVKHENGVLHHEQIEILSNSQVDEPQKNDATNKESLQEANSQAESSDYIPSQNSTEAESSQDTNCESSQSQSLENVDLSTMDWKSACFKLWEILWNSKFSTCLKEVADLDDGLAVIKEQLIEKAYKTAKQFKADVKRKFKKCKDNHKHGKFHEDCLELEKLFDSYIVQIIPETNKSKNRNSTEAGPSEPADSDSDVIASPRKKRKVNRVDSDEDDDEPDQQNKNKIKLRKLGDDSKKCIFLDDDKLTSTDVLISYNHQPLKRVNITARILKVYEMFIVTKNDLDLKRFIIKNDDGIEISCIAWEGQARKYDEILIEDRIVRIENAMISKLNDFSQCKGVFYELKINGDTEIYMQLRKCNRKPKNLLH